jgi:hypothetical protein
VQFLLSQWDFCFDSASARHAPSSVRSVRHAAFFIPIYPIHFADLSAQRTAGASHGSTAAAAAATPAAAAPSGENHFFSNKPPPKLPLPVRASLLYRYANSSPIETACVWCM